MSLDLSVDASRDITIEVCTYLCNLRFEDLPSSLVHQAKAAVLNSISCGLSSSPSTFPAAAKLYKAIDPLGKSPRPATVLAVQERASVDDAALINGLSMTARFFDDTHLETLTHPSGAPLAAALAYAETEGSSGRDLILAYIIGVEVGLTIAQALTLGPYKKGWHLTSIVGTFAATAAVSKLMKLSAQDFATALGHASSMSAGSRNVFATDTLIMHPGRAAQNGLLAARLAREGFTSTTHALEKWINLMCEKGEPDMTKLVDLAQAGNGKRKWLLMENAFKPYPCGIVIHPPIDAGIAAHKHFYSSNPEKQLKSDPDPLKASQIFTKISMRVTPMTIRLCGVQQPEKFMQILFSSHHGVAVGLVYGKGGLKEYSEDVANDANIRALRDIVELVPDETIRDDETVVTFFYKDSDGKEQKKEVHVEHVVGSLKNPMTDEQLNEKFVDQAQFGGLSDRSTKEAIRQCWALDELQDIKGLMRLLVPAERS